MSISQVLNYQIVKSPKKKLDLFNLEEIRKDLVNLAEEYSGEAVIILIESQAFWYYLLLFQALRDECAEIVCQIDDQKQILLYTVNQNLKEYARPLSIIINKNLLDFNFKENRKIYDNANFDLNSLDEFSPQEIDKLLIFLNKSKLAKKLILENETEVYKTMIALMLLGSQAEKIIFKTNDKLIKL